MQVKYLPFLWYLSTKTTRGQIRIHDNVRQVSFVQFLGASQILSIRGCLCISLLLGHWSETTERMNYKPQKCLMCVHWNDWIPSVPDKSIKYTGGHRSCHACFPDYYWHSVHPFHWQAQLRIMWTPTFLSWYH